MRLPCFVGARHPEVVDREEPLHCDIDSQVDDVRKIYEYRLTLFSLSTCLPLPLVQEQSRGCLQPLPC